MTKQNKAYKFRLYPTEEKKQIRFMNEGIRKPIC
ncbi:helix-turn-helix domain-containing protein [Bacillus tropicus]